MGRAPCCDKAKVKRGPWSPEEDTTLKTYFAKYGTGGNWIALPHKAGLKRCGKSCRLRWLNYLRPDIKHGGFTEEEDNTILTLYSNIGSRLVVHSTSSFFIILIGRATLPLKNLLLLVFTEWSVIASHLKGRTDNDVKNYWNTKLKKKMQLMENMASTITNTSCHFSPTPTLQSAPTADSIYFGTSGFSTMNYQHNSVAQTMVSDPNQFPLARLMEVQEQVTTSGYSSFSATSSSQEFLSTLSPQISLENGYASWSGSGGGEEEGFIVGLGSDPSADIVMDGFGIHEKIIGAGGDMTTINYSSLAGNVSHINSSLGFYQSVAN
ncbi:hypothetical protein RJ639_042412 [Escallonia herrerae]|uniref:Uncharacterized protein n=1 Tax=Escallonia herrerae TaxID=1293975 RepID=A0AA89B5Q2_9ASTE|nr:hypothetical protein RJ639_042412 [Escallonia herrerae]